MILDTYEKRLVTCDKCGSSIPNNLWKKNDKDEDVCPVCGAVRGNALSTGKVSLSKSDEGSEVTVPVPITKNETGSINIPSASSVLDAIDNGVKSIFGDSVMPCPECGKVICVCGLKGLFK